MARRGWRPEEEEDENEDEEERSVRRIPLDTRRSTTSPGFLPESS
jgi:hypothetical protein